MFCKEMVLMDRFRSITVIQNRMKIRPKKSMEQYKRMIRQAKSLELILRTMLWIRIYKQILIVEMVIHQVAERTDAQNCLTVEMASFQPSERRVVKIFLLKILN